MFNFFSILLLSIAVLQIVDAIKIWVKPSNLRYTAEISCDNSDGPITIGEATHFELFGETTGYVNIDTDLSRCDDHHNSTVKVQITELYCFRSDSPQFEIPKTELSARKSAVVLGYNIKPSEHKKFYFQQSSTNVGLSQRPLVNYELEIECEYRHADGNDQYYLIGSGIQLNGQNYINIPIYEIKMLAFCVQDKIKLVIHRVEPERTHIKVIKVTREFLRQNNAFNIDISAKTVQPIPQNGRGI